MIRAREVGLVAVVSWSLACASSTPPPASPRVEAPVTSVADASVADASVADASVADASLADASLADASVDDASPGVRSYRGRPEDEWIRLITERPVQRVVERFQSTLYVWHLDLGDGVEVSFQPEQERLETFWRREVASWHLARLLGITHRAPPTVSKRIPASALGRSARNTGIVVDRQGMVVGSASVWVPTVNRVNMHLAPARRVWSRWVNPAHPLPDDPRERERARQVAEVLVFDYLAANYDRWNCCNIGADENGDLVFRDNDAGWVASVINDLGSPGVVRRIPRYLWTTLQEATAERLRASIARDPEGARGHLIPDASYVGYERRRAALIANLRRMVERYGEAAVFPWP